MASRVPLEVAVFPKPVPRVGVFGAVKRHGVDAVKSVGGVAERAPIMIPTRGISGVHKATEVVPGQLRQPSARGVAFSAPVVQVAVSDHGAVVVGPPHHDFRSAPSGLPTPKVGAVQPVHAGLDVVPLVRGIKHTPVRCHPQIHGAVRPREELHVVHVGVRVTVRGEFSSPGDPVPVQAPVHATALRAPHANAGRKLTVRIGGTDIQGEVVVVLSAVAGAIFAPSQDVGVDAGLPRSAGTVPATHEFKRLSCVETLVHAVQPAAVVSLACGQHNNAVGVGRRDRQFTATLLVADAHRRPTRRARRKRRAPVNGPLEHGAVPQQLDGVARVWAGGVKRQFHVLPSSNLSHGDAAIVGPVQAVVRGRKQYRFFVARDRLEHQIAVPPVRGLVGRIPTQGPRIASVFGAPQLPRTRSHPHALVVFRMNGDAVNACQGKVPRHERPMGAVVDALPRPRRSRPTPHHLVVGRGLLHRVDVAGAGTLDLELHGHLRVKMPRSHFFPHSIFAGGRSPRCAQRLCIRPGHFRPWQLHVAQPPLVVLSVPVFFERMRGVMRFVGAPHLGHRRFSAVHQLHPQWVLGGSPVGGLGHVLGKGGCQASASQQRSKKKTGERWKHGDGVRVQSSQLRRGTSTFPSSMPQGGTPVRL